MCNVKIFYFPAVPHLILTGCWEYCFFLLKMFVFHNFSKQWLITISISLTLPCPGQWSTSTVQHWQCFSCQREAAVLAHCPGVRRLAEWSEGNFREGHWALWVSNTASAYKLSSWEELVVIETVVQNVFWLSMKNVQCLDSTPPQFENLVFVLCICWNIWSTLGTQ